MKRGHLLGEFKRGFAPLFISPFPSFKEINGGRAVLTY